MVGRTVVHGNARRADPAGRTDGDGGPRRANDGFVATCSVCGREYDERSYQLVVLRLGSFDSVSCVEEALRRQIRRSREALLPPVLDTIAAARADDADELTVTPTDGTD
jgi:hypothetical protein